MFGLCRHNVSASSTTGEGPATYLVWISDLLHNIMDLRNGQFDDFLLHPFGDLELFDELIFNIGDDLVTKCFCFCGERLLDKKAT
jgi:hypothetical protein